MDLGAYVQIDSLELIARENNIEVPRLRGLRLMSEESTIPETEIQQMLKACEVDVCNELCCSSPFWKIKANYLTWSSHTDRVCDYYLIKDGNQYTGIRWDRIHGWKRRVLKLAIKQQKKKIRTQWDMWNKYAGRADVLYIHARIGGGNWNYYGGAELTKQPWFLERADDCWDGTYCDIYALLNKGV